MRPNRFFFLTLEEELRRYEGKTNEVLTVAEEGSSMATSDVCFECHIKFALAEKRVQYEREQYHEDCAKRKRAERIKILFVEHCEELGLRVSPTHHVTRR